MKYHVSHIACSLPRGLGYYEITMLLVLIDKSF